MHMKKESKHKIFAELNFVLAYLLKSLEEIISRHPKIGQSTNRKCSKALSKGKSNSPNLPLSLSTTLRGGGTKRLP